MDSLATSDHLCHQSHVGALVYSEQIPMSKEMQAYAKKVRGRPLHWSLHGGEDYELLFTIPQKWQQKLEKEAKKRRMPISKIGVIQPKRFGIRIEDHDQKQAVLSPGSYEHFS